MRSPSPTSVRDQPVGVERPGSPAASRDDAAGGRSRAAGPTSAADPAELVGGDRPEHREDEDPQQPALSRTACRASAGTRRSSVRAMKNMPERRP